MSNLAWVHLQMLAQTGERMSQTQLYPYLLVKSY